MATFTRRGPSKECNFGVPVSVLSTEMRRQRSWFDRRLTFIMHATRQLFVLPAAFCVAGALGVTVFAQSASVTYAPTLERSSVNAVRQYFAAEVAIPEQDALPSNLLVAPLYRPLLESMMRQSPTFRRQCLRLANETWLTVSLRPSPPSLVHGARAITRIVRQSGRMFASVEVLPLSAGPEVIAHEIEHVIEQLDEIDLASKAELSNTGVRAHDMPGRVFETTRALRAGQKVAKEVRQANR